MTDQTDEAEVRNLVFGLLGGIAIGALLASYGYIGFVPQHPSYRYVVMAPHPGAKPGTAFFPGDIIECDHNCTAMVREDALKKLNTK